jgi:ATP-dependent helicase/nuclease subunit A
VRVESRSLLFAAQEIRDLTNILAAIDDPTDDIAVVAALRSSAFAVSDVDLLAHSNEGGRWDYTADAPASSPESIHEAWMSLRDFHAARWHASIGALVERVIAERKMLELAVTGRRPRESWRRLRFVSEQARALGDSGTVASLRQFVHWLRTQASERALIAEAVASEPDDDAVRLLTIHAAKGLEFPIVILAGLGIQPRRPMPRVAWAVDADGRDRVAVRTGRQDAYFDTPGYDVMLDSERDHSFLERDRLFYVAATRAKERLVVSTFFKPTKEDHSSKHAKKTCAIAECVSVVQSRHPEWDNLQYGMPMGPGETAETSVDDTPEQRETWIARRAELISRLGRAPVLAATAIAHVGADEESERDDVPEAEPWKKGRAGTSVGRAVHAVLQTIDLATGEGLEATAHAQSVAEGIAGEGARIAKLAEAARASSVVREAVAGGKFWREVLSARRSRGSLSRGSSISSTKPGRARRGRLQNRLRKEYRSDRAGDGPLPPARRGLCPGARAGAGASGRADGVRLRRTAARASTSRPRSRKTGRAQLSRVVEAHSLGKITPGLRIPWGSSACLMARIAAISAGERVRCSQGNFATPIPCSALMLPPSSATRRRTASSARSSSVSSPRMFTCRLPSPACPNRIGHARARTR